MHRTPERIDVQMHKVSNQQLVTTAKIDELVEMTRGLKDADEIIQKSI